MVLKVSFKESDKRINTEFKETYRVSDGGYDVGYQQGYQQGIKDAQPTETIEITNNGSYDVKQIATVNVNVPIPEGYLVPEGIFAADVEGSYDVTPYAEAVFTVQKEQISVTPTEETQTLIPTENKFFDQVIINPIPSEYLIPSGILEVTENGEHDVTNYEKVNVNIASSGSENRLKKLLDTTKSCKYLFQNYKGTSVDGLIKYDDTENVTTMEYMFYSCSKLTTIPQLDTSSVTAMSNMFNNCQALITIPQLDTSSVTTMSSMFNNCSELVTISLLDTSSVTTMRNMFAYSNNLTTIPLLDTSKVTDMYGMFNYCKSLKRIEMYGMKVNFDISASTQFETEDLVTILNNLATVTVTRILTMGATNLAKLSDEQKLIATNKGWTLA